MDLSGAVHKLDEQPVAHGGFSDIYRGILVKPPRAQQVAIKVIVTRHSNRETDRRIQRRLAREIITWENLNHPGVIKLLGICSGFGRFPALISPWYDNGSALTYLKTHPNVDRRNLVRGVIAAIDYLHGLQPPVVHGDIKAANVLIKNDGEACLGDFGLSRFIESASTGLTTTSPLGTPRWMAPELFFPIKDEVAPVTKEGDIYAFGCLAVEILTDQWPWYDIQSDRDVMLKVHEGQMSPRPESELAVRELTDELWELITSCWSYKPSERPRATAVHRRLLSVIGVGPPGSQDACLGLPSPAKGTISSNLLGSDFAEAIPAQNAIAIHVSSSSAASSPTPFERRLSGIDSSSPATSSGLRMIGPSPRPPSPRTLDDTLRPTPSRPSKPGRKLPKKTFLSDSCMQGLEGVRRLMDRRMALPDSSRSPDETYIAAGLMKIHDDMRLAYDHKITPDELDRNTGPNFQRVMGYAWDKVLKEFEDQMF
ncbi:hypothetical protein BOTBODRAFT_192789 [Botryobasidium botryosum FD-172 SS1]|uniref:Protein kinase domain-containing protein n=1 Tax=Botryobasidium botryosum (strain FD-172 SS1) TaxID=930990 RepID=A0A067M4T8_BOTB1|nr:hypothetical protein BOTBODRAFT_192789 [Botryobasidium botryosum FD-172 SS1]